MSIIEWHKFPDKKPEFSGYFLAATDTKEVFAAYWQAYSDEWDSDDIPESEVIAWAEFPEYED